MTFQSAPDCAEAVIQATYGGVNIANVLNFKKTGGYDQDAIDALAELVDAAVGDAYLPICNSQVGYTSTLVRGLTESVDLTASRSTNAGSGALTSNPLPANVTLCATLKTGFTGRSARGRFYAFPTAQGQLASADAFISDYGDGLIAFLQEVKDNAFLADWKLIVLSRSNGGARRGTAIGTNVSAVVLRNLLSDSQRHRLPRGH
jgi:hypothetical protein